MTKLASLVQFKRKLMFCLEDWSGTWASCPPLVYVTVAWR